MDYALKMALCISIRISIWSNKTKNKDMFVELCSSDSIFLSLGCHFRSTNYFAWTQRTVLSKRFSETKVQCQWLKDKCTHWIFKMNWMTAYFDFILILTLSFNRTKKEEENKKLAFHFASAIVKHFICMQNRFGNKYHKCCFFCVEKPKLLE